MRQVIFVNGIKPLTALHHQCVPNSPFITKTHHGHSLLQSTLCMKMSDGLWDFMCLQAHTAHADVQMADVS